MNSFTTVHINCCYCIFVSYFNKTSLWYVEELLPFYGHLISNSFKQVITPSELKARGFEGMLIVSVGKCVFFCRGGDKKKKKNPLSVYVLLLSDSVSVMAVSCANGLVVRLVC